MLSSLRTPRCFALAGALLAACGGDHRDAPVDAPPTPPIDSTPMPDVPAPIDASSRVSVTVLTELGDGLPDTSARVIFADASRHLVQQGLVGAAGDASADLPLGGFVHVLHASDDTPTSRSVTLVSIRVKPGDSVTFGAAASKPLGATIKVQGTFTPVPSVSSNYAFYHRCGGGFTQAVEGNVARLTAAEHCLPPSFDVLGVTDSPASAGIVPHFVWFTATPAGGFTAPDMQLSPDFAVNVHHVPVGNFVAVRRVTQLPPFFADGADASGRTTAAAATVSLKVPYPPPPSGVAAIGVAEARVSESEFARGLQVVRTRVAASAAAADVDLDALPLPVITTDPMLSGKIVSWTQTGTGTPDVREVTITSAYNAGGLSYSVRWTVLDGSTESSLELPGLPDTFADFDLTQQPAPKAGGGSVLYVDYSNVAGFDAARKLPLSSLTGHGSVLYGTGLFEDALFTVHASMR